MALLLHSQKCKHSTDIVAYINSVPQLKQIVRFQDVNISGVPDQYRGKITSVPTMLTQTGKLLVGQEIRQWLQSLLPVQEIAQCKLGGGFGSLASFDGTDDSAGNFFDLDMYGQSMQPAMTPDIQQRISRNVNDAYTNTIKK